MGTDVSPYSARNGQSNGPRTMVNTGRSWLSSVDGCPSRPSCTGQGTIVRDEVRTTLQEDTLKDGRLKGDDGRTSNAAME
jgi:hypothetical protein